MNGNRESDDAAPPAVNVVTAIDAQQVPVAPLDPHLNPLPARGGRIKVGGGRRSPSYGDFQDALFASGFRLGRVD